MCTMLSNDLTTYFSVTISIFSSIFFRFWWKWNNLSETIGSSVVVKEAKKIGLKWCHYDNMMVIKALKGEWVFPCDYRHSKWVILMEFGLSLFRICVVFELIWVYSGRFNPSLCGYWLGCILVESNSGLYYFDSFLE